MEEESVKQDLPAIELTPREYEVFQLIGQGFTNDEISRKLYISPGTVKTHIKHLYAKCDLSKEPNTFKRAKLCLLAIRTRVSHPDPLPYQIIPSKRYSNKQQAQSQEVSNA